MSHGEYMEILSKVEIDLWKEDIQFQEAVSPTDNFVNFSPQIEFKIFITIFTMN